MLLPVSHSCCKLDQIVFSYSDGKICSEAARRSRSGTLLKKRLWHRGFPVNFAKFLRIPFLTEHLPSATLFKKETLAQVLSCEFCEISKNAFCYRTPPVAAFVRCRRKVAAAKIEKLKAFIIKYYHSKTYSVQFHLFCLVNFSYFYFFIHGFQSSILHKLKNTLNC